MIRTFKKVLSFFLVVIIAVSIALLSNLVGVDISKVNFLTIKAEAAKYTGKCGDNLTWSFNDSTGVFVITGNGKMQHYYTYAERPWNSYKKFIKSITIENGVTNISNYAFHGCENLESITIPDSVTSIGSLSFVNCKKLTQVTIPNDVTQLGDGTFAGCESLKDINIPYGVKYITDGQFSGCASLERIIIPDSVTSIWDNAFSECVSLKNIVIPDSVESIPDYAFYECSNLTDVYFGNNINSIGTCAFSLCYNLKNVYYSGTPEQWSDIDIAQGNDCLTGNIIFESNSENPYSIWGMCGDNLKWKLSINGELEISGSGKMIDWNPPSSRAPWYNERNNIKSVTINSGVTSVGNYAFMGYENITSVSLADTVESLGFSSFSDCVKLSEISISDSVTEFKPYTFSGCSNLEEITFPKNVTNLGNYLFMDCSNLKRVILPNNITQIPEGMFCWCYELEYVKIPDSVLSIGNSAFEYCNKLKSIEIPNNVTTIGNYAFYSCEELESIKLHVNLNRIGENAFNECSKLSKVNFVGTPEQWDDISIERNNYVITHNLIFECESERPSYGSGVYCEGINWKLYVDGELVVTGNGEMKTSGLAPWYDLRSKIKIINISEGISSVDNLTFRDIEQATTVKLPNSVKSIGENSFYNCFCLNDIIYNGNINEWNEIDIKSKNENLLDASIQFSEYITSFIINDVEVSQFVKIGDTVTCPELFNKPGFSILWSPELPDSMPNQNMTFIGCYVANSYTAKFDANGGNWADGEFLKIVATDFDSEIVAPENPTRQGFDFAGWDSEVGAMDDVNGKSFKAKWVARNDTEYTIEFYTMGTDGKYNVSREPKIGTTDTEASVTAIETSGFTINSAKSNLSGNIEADGSLVLSIYYDRNMYAFVTIVDGKTTSKNYYFDATITKPANPVKPGYKFVGWDNTISLTMPANDVTITAKFELSFKMSIRNTSTTTISYGDSIILHADMNEALPSGWKIKWTADNGNFSYSENGETCTISPNKSGDTTFTATVYDENGNEISKDTQTMKSKAGFFDKIIAFFKKIFGATKVIPQAFKGVF